MRIASIAFHFALAIFVACVIGGEAYCLVGVIIGIPVIPAFLLSRDNEGVPWWALIGISSLVALGFALMWPALGSILARELQRTRFGDTSGGTTPRDGEPECPTKPFERVSEPDRDRA